MYNKEKNIINPADAANLTGNTEANIKASLAGDSVDFKATGNCSPLASGSKSDIKTRGSNSALAGKLYLLILIGLCAAVLLLLTGFGLNFFNGAGSLSLDSLHEHALTPADLTYLLKNNQMPASLIISYVGLLGIILVPVTGLIYILGYFTHRKKYNLALAAAGVLFILILSAVIGLLKS